MTYADREPAVVPAREESKAIMRSKMGNFVPIGCTCGARLRFEETLQPGSVIGGYDAIFTAWKGVHSLPGCRFAEAQPFPPEGG